MDRDGEEAPKYKVEEIMDAYIVGRTKELKYMVA